MKEMKKQFYMRWDEPVFILVIEAVFFLLGEFMLGVAVFVYGDADSIFPIGTLMAFMAAGFMMLFVEISAVPLCFNLSVSMGAVRRRLVPALFAMSFLDNLLAAAVACLLYPLEQQILRRLYAGIPVEIDFTFLFRLDAILLGCLAVAAVSALFGAMFLRFGKITAALLWLLIALGAVSPRIKKLLDSGQDRLFARLFQRCTEFSEGGIGAVVIVLSAAMLLAAWILLRRQKVEI